MAKKQKNTTTPVEEAEKLAQERTKLIHEFNANNAGKYWIDESKVPTEEDVANAKKDFEDKTKALQEKDDYLVADKDNALRVAKFILYQLDNGYWQGTIERRMFIGIMNMHDYIEKFIEEYEKEPKDLVMEYGPMQFCCVLLENYGGHGYADAKLFAEKWDEYVSLYDTLRDHVEYYNSEVKKCQSLCDRWALMEQGFYMNILEEPEQEDHTAEVAEMEAKAENVVPLN